MGPIVLPATFTTKEKLALRKKEGNAHTAMLSAYANALVDTWAD